MYKEGDLNGQINNTYTIRKKMNYNEYQKFNKDFYTQHSLKKCCELIL